MTDKHHFTHCDITEKLEPFHYKGCGLDNIYLWNGYEIKDTPYGRTVAVKHADELHEAVGIYLVTHQKTLTPKEIRFLRKHLDLTQIELANLMGQSAQQFARWEKGECDMPGPAERLLRLIYLGKCMGKEELTWFLGLLTQLNELDETTQEALTFESADHGWEKTAA